LLDVGIWKFILLAVFVFPLIKNSGLSNKLMLLSLDITYLI